MLALACMLFKAFLEARVCNTSAPLSAVRAELVEKWKAEREARLARGEKEEEEEEEEVNIYAVPEEEVCMESSALGAHCLLCAVGERVGGILAPRFCSAPFSFLPWTLGMKVTSWDHREGSREERLGQPLVPGLHTRMAYWPLRERPS